MQHLVYDFETGSDKPNRTQPLQFAAIRTDSDFAVLGDPIEILTRPAIDFPVHLDAISVNRLKLDLLISNGLPELESSRIINALLTQANTVSISYNGAKYDEELVRFCNWRNFLPPYDFEWRNGCGRFDPLPFVRLLHACNPEAIAFPRDDSGRPSFSLDALCQANGISNGVAHNAITDVLNLAQFLAFIKRQGGDLFSRVYAQRNKFQAKEALESSQAVLVSGRYDEGVGVAAFPATLLCFDPKQSNKAYLWDLRKEMPRNFNYMSDAQIAELGVYGNQNNPIVSVNVNKAPAFVSLDMVPSGRLLQLYGMGVNAFALRAKEIRNSISRPVAQKVANVEAYPDPVDVDIMLYSAFIPDADRAAVAKAREIASALGEVRFPTFTDNRLGRLCERLYCRSRTGGLSGGIREAWRDRLAEVWFGGASENQETPWDALRRNYSAILAERANGLSPELEGYLVYAQHVSAQLSGYGLLRQVDLLHDSIQETTGLDEVTGPEGVAESASSSTKRQREKDGYQPSF